MTLPRCEIVDSSVTPIYHCVSRCVRRARLCGEGHEHRKQWIEERLQELAGIFAVEVCGYAVLDNHLHVILRLDDETAAAWSDEQVVRRWGQLHPPRGKNRKPQEVTEEWVEAQLADPDRVADLRERLNSLGWFMKSLKEPLARMANKEDGCRGTFWEARYKSIAVLDDEALLTTMTYVDLNPLAAGLAKTPEQSLHTSVKTRLDHCRQQGTLDRVLHQPADRTRHDMPLEDPQHWLVPIEDRRDHRESARTERAGLCANMNLASYLRLLDWSARLFRPGKCRLPKDVAGILDRLGSNAELWSHRLGKLRDRDRLYGSVFATRHSAVDRMAAHRGLSRLANLNGCPS